MQRNFYRKFLGLSYALENNIIIESVKRGLLMTLPALFIGAIALVITSFPVPEFQTWLLSLLDGAVYQLLDVTYQITYGFLAIYLTIAISYNCAKRLLSAHVFSQNICVLISVMCLIESLGIGREDFSYKAFGTTGTFTAIVVAITVPFIFNWIQKRMKGVSGKSSIMVDELDYQHLQYIFIPSYVCLFVFGLINIILVMVWNISSLNDLFANFFGFVFQSMGVNVFSGILFLLFSGILWFFGVHGGNALAKVSQNVFVPANTLPDVTVSKQFIDVFGLMGGCGATICLLIAILIFSRKKNHRTLAKASIAMVIFNVNEILVFGVPIMFNPIMLIPFLLTPIISVLIAYGAVSIGLISITTTAVTWTTPVLFSGYVLTGSIAGSLVQLVSIIVGVMIYAPFVRLMEKVEQQRSDFHLDEIEHLFKENLKKGNTLILNDMRHGLDRMYHMMVVAMGKDLKKHKIPVFYQPQVNTDGKIIGAEALLRWNFKGRIMFPPLVVEMAKEEKYMNDLSIEVLKKSCKDTLMFLEYDPNFKMSVNMVAEQMDDRGFVEQVILIIKEHKLEKNICLEITEETNIESFDNVGDNVLYLKENGIRMALDDFGMGHTSLKYLQENLFDYVKLDGKLVNDIMNNDRSETIVKSIIQLENELNFMVIAEYVDTEEKRDLLINLGCKYLQGFLYSPAIPVDEFTSKYY